MPKDNAYMRRYREGRGSSSGKGKSSGGSQQSEPQYESIKSFNIDDSSDLFIKKRGGSRPGARSGSRIYEYHDVPTAKANKIMKEIRELPVGSRVEVTVSGFSSGFSKRIYEVISDRSGFPYLHSLSNSGSEDIPLSKNMARFVENRRKLYPAIRYASKIDFLQKKE